MAKRISSLSIVLGATVSPFVQAFGSVRGVVGDFLTSMANAGSAVSRFTGLAGAVRAATGGVRSAISSLSGAFVTLTGAGLAVDAIAAAVRRLAAAPGDAIAAAERQSDAETKLRAVLQATGGAAGYSAEQLIAHAGALEESTTFSDESIIEFQSVLATFKNISGKAFDGATQAALDMSTVMGIDLPEAGKLLGKALNSPVDGIRTLRRAGVQFTDAQISQIKAMTAAGNVAGAQGIILDELAAKYGGAAEAIARTPFGRLKQLGNGFENAVEKVGTVLATVGASIAGAFDLRGVIAELNNGLAWVQSMLPTIVGYVVPYIQWIVSAVEEGASLAWGYVSWALGAIYDYAAPIVASVYSVVAANWQGIVQTTIAYWMAAYDFISSVLGAAWSIVSAVWSAVVDVWQWGCNLIGYQTQAAGTQTGTAVQGMIDAWEWLQSTTTEILNVASFAISHLTDIVQYAGTTAAYYIVQLYNQIEYYFAAGIEYVKWFGQNFTSIIVDAFNLGATITQNGVKNVAAIISNLPGLIAGTTDLSDIWTPLTQGFEATTSALPTIADRVPGALEQALGDQSKSMGDNLVDGLVDNLNSADKRAGAAAKGITSGIESTIGKFHLPTFDVKAAAQFDPKTLNAGTNGLANGASTAGDAVDKLNGKVKKTADSWKALGAGSAEAMQAAAKAGFEAQVSDSPGKGSAAASANVAGATPSSGFATPAWFGGMRQPTDSASGGEFQAPDWFRDPAASPMPAKPSESGDPDDPDPEDDADAPDGVAAPTVVTPAAAPVAVALPASATDALANAAKSTADAKSQVDALAVLRQMLTALQAIQRSGGVVLNEA